jgi:hypothetical protein
VITALAFASVGVAASATIKQEVATTQTGFQIFIAAFMFGYYFGISLKERENYSYFLSGFLGGSLTLGLLLFVFVLQGEWYWIVGSFCMPLIGWYFGITRPAFGKQNLDKLLRELVNTFGWTVEAAGVIVATLNIQLNIPVDWRPVMWLISIPLLLIIGKGRRVIGDLGGIFGD